MVVKLDHMGRRRRDIVARSERKREGGISLLVTA
jgi:hypothetical protein